MDATLANEDRRRQVHPTVTAPRKGEVDVRAIRLGCPGGMGATQAAFAGAIGVAVKTVRNWEQRRREPTGPARVLLAIVAHSPWLIHDLMNDPDKPPVA